ncbi:hypothetical protein ANCDUO_12000 [Ancylostoma duodenale]|uniref:Uncharacterized protein n=1 Tax=Ancylostoma duodenale TaxID=51022 RepID=A0A0C2GL54_9BILA|nr:hypothetical protein ANCDUO_12000 [Ancylostoma duodenale]
MEKRGFPRTRVLPLWIEVWLAMSAIICFLDVMFTMLRPHTTEGVLAGIYYGWNLYASVDVRYADTKDIVTCATGRVMLVEIAMNLIAVYLSRRRSRHALITAFTTTAFVFWKTVWFLTLYVMPPPGFWVLVPFIVMISLWDKLAVPVDAVEQYKAISTA